MPPLRFPPAEITEEAFQDGAEEEVQQDQDPVHTASEALLKDIKFVLKLMSCGKSVLKPSTIVQDQLHPGKTRKVEEAMTFCRHAAMAGLITIVEGRRLYSDKFIFAQGRTWLRTRIGGLSETTSCRKQTLQPHSNTLICRPRGIDAI